MDAFTARLGVSEGRVERAPGDVVFALGDLTGVAVVRVTGTLRAPPAGRWRVSLRIGGFDAAALNGWPGRTRAISDLAANVSGASSPTELAVRLSFLGG